MTDQKITKAQLRKVRCGVGHSGNHQLVATANRRSAECQGCGTYYTAEQVNEPAPADRFGSGHIVVYR